MAYSSFKAWFETVSNRWGGRNALTFVRNGRMETRLTYFELYREVERFTRLLSGYGLDKGDRVVLLLDKSVIAVVAHLSILNRGLVSVPLNPGFTKRELVYLIGDADPGVIVTGSENRDRIRALTPGIPLLITPTEPYTLEQAAFRSDDAPPPDVEISSGDPALMIYTSGTTGKPKGALLTHGNLVRDAENIIRVWQMTHLDLLCHALPLFHIHGLCFALHTALLCGSHTRLLDRFEPDAVIDNLSRNRDGVACTVFMAVPAMYTRMMDRMGGRKFDFGHLRLLASGSAPLPEKSFQRIKETFGMEPVEREGMSETGMNFSNPLNGIRKPGSIGLPLPGVSVRVVDPKSGVDLPSGQVGEIWLKSGAITPGYWRKPEETRVAFQDGWFKTGDLGKVDPDGYYFLTDRIKHIIITGGENVSAKEVESVIDTVEGVVESVVVGVADERWGERVVAAVKIKPESGLKAPDIQKACRESLHAWKCPKEILFINKIPRNTMGKVLKNVIKKMVSADR